MIIWVHYKLCDHSLDTELITKKIIYIYIYIYSSSIRISDKIKIFNDQKINNDINVDKILISKKEPHSQKSSFKYFLG